MKELFPVISGHGMDGRVIAANGDDNMMTQLKNGFPQRRPRKLALFPRLRRPELAAIAAEAGDARTRRRRGRPAAKRRGRLRERVKVN